MKLTNMSVELIDSMGTDLTVVNAARVSFAKCKEVMDSKDESLIKYLAEHNHWTPFAHCTITLRIKAPIFVSRQLVKHTIGLVMNEESRRYITEEPEFYLPDIVRRNADNVKQGSSNEPVKNNKVCVEVFEEHIKECLDTYNFLLEEGTCPEQARMVLPLNTMTNWYWTGSLQAFARVCNLRLDSHSQKETQEIAKLISEIMNKLYPISWKYLVKV